jgi:hypothetical protein
MKEFWKPVPGYEGLYEASNLGNIRSPERITFREKNPLSILKAHNLKPSIQIMPGGYKRYRVNLYKDKKSRTIHWHKIIALTFIPNPLNKPMINHIDNNPLNNNINNLEWCTNAENLKHSARQGRLNRGEKNAHAKLKDEHVSFIRSKKSYSLEEKRKLMKQYGISSSHLNSLIRGINWKHIP